MTALICVVLSLQVIPIFENQCALHTSGEGKNVSQGASRNGFCSKNLCTANHGSWYNHEQILDATHEPFDYVGPRVGAEDCSRS